MRRGAGAIGLLLFAGGACLLTDRAVSAAPSLDLQLSNRMGFVNARSFTQVRENDIEGTRLPFSDLGVHSVQVPALDGALWFNDRNAARFQFRYFAISGSRNFDTPVNFNGATIAPNQSLKDDPVWYSMGLAYEHRWRPAWFAKGDVSASLGLEYTWINFRINGGRAPVTASSLGTETKEDFYMQELPVPTLGFGFHRRVSSSVILSGALSGNWINHWNSQRKEGGTVYLSQRKLDADLQARLANDRTFRSLHPMIGLFYEDFYQNEQSKEDGNVLRLSMMGPEVGLEYEF